jgi:hypothetical protein
MLRKQAMVIAKPKFANSQHGRKSDFDLQEEELTRFLEALKHDDYLHSKLFVKRLEEIQKAFVGFRGDEERAGSEPPTPEGGQDQAASEDLVCVAHEAATTSPFEKIHTWMMPDVR